jgi:hypothetical protein
MSNHFSSINNFRPLSCKATCVAEHFNLKNHFFKLNLSIYIFKVDIEDLDRFNCETDLIHFFL